jgi:hypothetical protein
VFTEQVAGVRLVQQLVKIGFERFPAISEYC